MTLLTLAAGSFAQAYPAKAIRIIVPYAPGGSTDLLGRIAGQKLNEAWGQPVVIENRAGASAIIGTEATVRSAPDGYTFMVGALQPIVLNKFLFKKLPYDPDTDLATISINLLVPNYIVVHPSLPVRNIKELIAFAKANRGKVTFASSNNASSGHLTGLLLNKMAGIDMEHIGYKGSAPATAETVGGHVPILVDQPVPSLEQVRAGRLRAIAVGTAQRVEAMPNVPTVRESGLPEFESSTWFGFFAPRATPADITGKLHNEFARIMALADVKDKFVPQGYVPVAMNADEARKRIASDREKWGRVIAETGLKMTQ
jgi:tripartite-type tricarboxylate transporter receptor subunit TctC